MFIKHSKFVALKEHIKNTTLFSNIMNNRKTYIVGTLLNEL